MLYNELSYIINNYFILNKYYMTILYLPKEILITIISYLDIQEQCRCIYIFNLPKRIPHKLNKEIINNMDNLFIKIRLIRKALSKVFNYYNAVDIHILQMFLVMCKDIGYNLSHDLFIIQQSYNIYNIQNQSRYLLKN
jgi:hypothetical protein